MAAKKRLEAQQEQEKNALGAGNPAFVEELWFNFRALQIFDLLSLYFCCDGLRRRRAIQRRSDRACFRVL